MLDRRCGLGVLNIGLSLGGLRPLHTLDALHPLHGLLGQLGRLRDGVARRHGFYGATFTATPGRQPSCARARRSVAAEINSAASSSGRDWNGECEVAIS